MAVTEVKWLSTLEMDPAKRIQIRDEAVYISYSVWKWYKLKYSPSRYG